MKNLVTELAKCKEFGRKFIVDEDFWNDIQEIISVLKPAYIFTKEMQRPGYGLADFYIGWIRVTINLTRIRNNEPKFDLASILLENMKERALHVLHSPLMLCAVYLDPRIMFKLSDDQKAKAATDLLKIHERMTDMARNSNERECNLHDTLDEIQDDYHTEHNDSQYNSQIMLQMLSIYETEKPYDIRAPVMQFWFENKIKYELIRPIADLVHAVPSNQCTTESAFSSLSYIRSKHRMSMSPRNLSNVLMVRLNKEVFHAMRQEYVQKILDK